jgi:putative transcription factor
LILLKYLLGGGGANRQHVTTKNTAKLDRETEELKHDQIPLELGKLIQQGRQNKGLSQKDLATVKYLYFYKY